MKTIRKKYIIDAPVEEVWAAFVDPVEINKWGAGPAKMSDKNNFKFSLWGGDIYGKNIKVEKNKKLTQEWFGGKWDEASIANFNFYSKKNKTEIELLHENVPDNEAKDIDSGWDDYYLGSIKEYLEK